MGLEFVDRDNSPDKQDSVAFEIWDKENNSQIGYAEGYLGRDHYLIAVINIFEKYRKKGIGKTALLKVIESLGGLSEISGLIGEWHRGGEFDHLEKNRSTNLLIFQERLQKGDSQTEAAAATPTGKWAASLGYTEIKIDSVGKDQVSVVFTKPK